MRAPAVPATALLVAFMAAIAAASAQTPPPVGYVPPPPVGPDASTEQPPVVDQGGSSVPAAERCREAPESAMAAAVIPLELMLCALSAPWRSEATVASPDPDPAMR